MSASASSVDGLVLAGGTARRMGGGDKGLLTIDGRSILARIVATLRPQCDHLLLSANGAPERFAALGVPIVADALPARGPLGGLLAGMDWTALHRPSTKTLLSVSGDTPFLPHDLVATLLQARQFSDAIATAMSHARVHSTVALWPVALRDELRTFLTASTASSVKGFALRYGVIRVAWPDAPVDPFANVNTPDDLDRARASAARRDSVLS